MLHTLLTIGDALITIALCGYVIWDAFYIHKLKRVIEVQEDIIEIHVALFKLAGLKHFVCKEKQEKCYGSTADSKPVSQDSSPCSCANIMKELNK